MVIFARHLATIRNAHKREKAKFQSQPILKENARVYNRLKARKQNGKLTEAEWNTQVADIQELKVKALRGEYSDAVDTANEQHPQ